MSEIARALGEDVGSDVKNAFATMLKRLSELGPLAGASLNLASSGVGGSVLAAGMSLAGKFAENMVSGPTLDKLRNDLHFALKHSGRRILVVIDDIDRLTPNEALEMLSLVKSLGDLPNVLYLLTFDQPRMIDSLRRVNVDSEFMEKIIQYSIWLPPLGANSLFELLVADLTAMIGEMAEHLRDELQDAWLIILKYYISTPRDVRRLMNNVVVNYGVHGEDVDLVDLVIVEAINIADPGFYAALREGAADLAGL